MLEQITDLLLKLVDQVGLIGIFLASAIESFFAPIPSEIVLFTGGLYSKTQGGIPFLILVAIVAALGSYVGTLPFYLIARFSADNWLPRFIKKFGKYLLISQKDMDNAHTYFERRGSVTVFIARLIPGVRSLIAFPAGVVKMNFAKYSFFTILGSFIWNMILASIGFAAYDKKEEFFKLIDPIDKVIILILVTLVLIYLYMLVRNFNKIKHQANSK